MTDSQAFEIAMAILQNEIVDSLAEMSDSQIGMYLVDRGIDETGENITRLRNA
jgi:hypothetical protein